MADEVKDVLQSLGFACAKAKNLVDMTEKKLNFLNAEIKQAENLLSETKTKRGKEINAIETAKREWEKKQSEDRINSEKLKAQAENLMKEAKAKFKEAEELMAEVTRTRDRVEADRTKIESIKRDLEAKINKHNEILSALK